MLSPVDPLDPLLAATLALTAWRVLPARAAYVPGLASFPASLLAFVLVVLALLANQVAFNAYVLAAHGGDPSFIARHLPPGWFAVAADEPLIRWLAGAIPPAVVPRLEWSVLRVNALLELPFALSAALAVAHRIDPWLHAFLLRSRLAILAAVAITIAAVLDELSLQSPYTSTDLAARALSLALTLAVLARWRGLSHDGPLLSWPPAAAPRVLLWKLVGVGAIAGSVVVASDLALFYNFGRIRSLGPVLAVGLIAAVAAARQGDDDPGPGGAWSLRLATAAAAGFAALFAPSAVLIRYRWGAGWGAPALLALAALTLAWLYLRIWPHVPRASRRGVLARAGIAAAAALAVAATDAGGLLAGSWLEAQDLRMFQRAALFVVPFVGLWRLAERATAPAN